MLVTVRGRGRRGCTVDRTYKKDTRLRSKPYVASTNTSARENIPCYKINDISTKVISVKYQIFFYFSYDETT